MLRRQLLGTSVIATAAGLAGTSVLADITAGDVWDNHVAYYEATGASVSGTPRADGDTVVIDGAAALYTLPFGAGSFSVSLPPLQMMENGDGTVSIQDTGSFDVMFEMNIQGEDPLSLTIRVDQTGYVASASGTPDDITYNYAADAFTVTLTDLGIPEEEMDFVMSATGEGYNSAVKVTEGDMLVYSSATEMGPVDFEYAIGAGNSFSSTSTGRYEASTSEMVMSLLPGGADILNLTPALKEGMQISVVTTSDGNAGASTTLLDGAIMSEQTTTSGASVANFVVDANGLDLGFTVDALGLSMLQPDLFPLPIDVTAGEMAAGYKFPLVAGPEPQDFGFYTRLTDLAVSDDLWNLIDGAQTLPRDPMSMNIDLAGTTITDLDVMDFLTLEQKLDGPVPPFTLESLTVTEMDANALGATLDGSANLTFDNADMISYGGMPAPLGEAFFAVTGANALMDKLEAMGLMSPDDIAGARMGIAFVGRATGDDAFETAVEFGPEGSLSVNGQRMR